MTLHTPRCTLTPLRPTDLPGLQRLHTDPRVRRFLGGPREAPSFAEARENEWAIRTDACTFLGWITLDRHHGRSDHEVSYLLLPEWWGRGLATEAVGAVLAHGRDTLGLKRILAETQTDNDASIRLLKRLGMRLDSQLQRFGEAQSVFVWGT